MVGCAGAEVGVVAPAAALGRSVEEVVAEAGAAACHAAAGAR